MDNIDNKNFSLPGLNCGSCGFKTCAEMSAELAINPESIKKCVNFKIQTGGLPEESVENFGVFGWKDIYGREYDFILDKFEGDEGPRETIHLFNFQVVKDNNLKVGDIIFGRPMAAGCPVTHCGKILKIDFLSGLIDWCVVGPLAARAGKAVDIGAYGPVGFDGIIKKTKIEPKIGMRYYWMPRSCMIQWRHCGLITSIARDSGGYYKVRIEGVYLG